MFLNKIRKDLSIDNAVSQDMRDGTPIIIDCTQFIQNITTLLVENVGSHTVATENYIDLVTTRLQFSYIVFVNVVFVVVISIVFFFQLMWDTRMFYDNIIESKRHHHNGTPFTSYN